MIQKTLSLLFILCFTIMFSKAQVSISITNTSKIDFNSLKINIFGKKYEFGALKAGKTTDTIIVEKTYSNFYAEVQISNIVLVSQPTDFVGEKLYTSGALNINFNIQDTGSNRRIQIYQNKVDKK